MGRDRCARRDDDHPARRRLHELRRNLGGRARRRRGGRGMPGNLAKPVAVSRASHLHAHCRSGARHALRKTRRGPRRRGLRGRLTETNWGRSRRSGPDARPVAQPCPSGGEVDLVRRRVRPTVAVVRPLHDAARVLDADVSGRGRDGRGRGPCGPAGPAGPCAPVAPVSPLSPFAPCGPAAPVAPVSPFAPCGPAAPLSRPSHPRTLGTRRTGLTRCARVALRTLRTGGALSARSASCAGVALLTLRACRALRADRSLDVVAARAVAVDDLAGRRLELPAAEGTRGALVRSRRSARRS